MLKPILFATVAILSVPAFAQDKQAPVQNSSAAKQNGDAAQAKANSSSTVPQADASTTENATAPADGTAEPATTSVTPVTPATAPATPPADAATPPAGAPAGGTASAQPATDGGQVATIVNNEFATYDKDSNGQLDSTEFAAWMVALKKASDPSTDAAAPQTQAWVNTAFGQADGDKSKSVSKDELIHFLTPAAAS